jgi:hypothetical protein
MCSPRLPRLWKLVDLLRDLGANLPTIPTPRIRTRAAALAVTLAAARAARHPLPTRTRPPARFAHWTWTVARWTDPDRAA